MNNTNTNTNTNIDIAQLSSSIIVSSIRIAKPSDVAPHAIYVGRSNKSYGLPSSPLANPYTKKQLPIIRHNLITYTQYLIEAVNGKYGDQLITTKKELHRLVDIAQSGQQIILLCWCVKMATLNQSECPDTLCHAFIIKNTILWLIKKKTEINK